MKETTVLALGMFDGVHLGHQALIAKAADIAEEMETKALAFTFSNHPGEVFGRRPKLLTDFARRDALLLEAGAHRVETIAFTKEFADLSPETFVRMLVETYRPHAIVTGFNYTFGRRGEGTPASLKQLGEKLGFSSHCLPPVLFCGEPISSTRIRIALEAGEMELANAMLGRCYNLSGRVVHNLQNGRKIGFPTANILPDPMRAIPKEGVYVTECIVPEGRFFAITNVGKNPTVNGKKQSIESHLLDYAGDLYGQEIAVNFHCRIRDEQRFDGLSALQEQLGRDQEFAREYLEKIGAK